MQRFWVGGCVHVGNASFGRQGFERDLPDPKNG